MAATSAPSAFGIFARLPLSEPVIEKYRSEALNYGITVEELMANRLMECASYNATKPLYFDDAQRRELEAILGRNIDKPPTVLAMLKKTLSIKINGIAVTLTPDVIQRLQTRHHNGNFGEWLSGLVNAELERYVGLR